jgi:GT2 family glycosyltransferase
MRSMNVSLVTRCHNAFELTNEFLLSWGNQLDDFFEVIVVDDGSTPDIHSRLVEKWGQSVTIIKTEKYFEYCRSLNIGIKTAKANGAEIVFCVNNDTKDFSINFVETIRSHFKSDEKLALLGPYVTDYDGTVLSDGSDKLKFGVVMNVPTEGYALCLASFEKIGFFDVSLVRYFEDIDVIIKLRAAGYSVYSSQKLKFSHLCNGSSSKQPWVPTYYRARNTQWFVDRYCLDRPFGWRLKKRANAMPFAFRRFKIFLSKKALLKAAIVPIAYVAGTAVGFIRKW